MQAYDMLKGAKKVVAGVSGGADSVFLFLVLEELCKKAGILLEVIHVHHGIRGDEADRDASYVKMLCEGYGISCRMVNRDIVEEAKCRHLTLEEAGRIARYEIFEEEMRRSSDVRIALAHHKNDAAETLLFNLSRGTGLLGLGSLQPVRGCYIRPLLCLTREEIEAALLKKNVRWCEDSTNREDEAARNRIRHHVLPYLTQEINAQAVSHIAETARIAADASAFIADEAKKRAKFYLSERDGGCCISQSMMKKEPRLMQEEIVRIAVAKTLNTLKDVSSLHIRLILELFDRENGKFLNLPKGLTAQKKREYVWLIKYDSPKKNTRKHGNVIL